MSDPSMYQFQLDWDFPAASFARSYAYRGAGSGACARAGVRSRFFWLLVGAGATYWWMRASKQRKALKDAERKQRARKDRKPAREEWVLRLTREVVDDTDDQDDDARSEDDEELARVRTRKRNLGAEAADTVRSPARHLATCALIANAPTPFQAVDVLEVALDSISLAVSNLKGVRVPGSTVSCLC